MSTINKNNTPPKNPSQPSKPTTSPLRVSLTHVASTEPDETNTREKPIKIPLHYFIPKLAPAPIGQRTELLDSDKKERLKELRQKYYSNHS